jgi:MFS family permease
MNAQVYKKYLLIVLSVALAFSGMDGLALGLVMQNIKVDLHLSDTQLGLLTGIAFALFYSTMGIPIARWADRGNRVTIISLTVALWSIAVALCGVVANFLQLMLVRVGVGVGESGALPTALSLIADYFTRAERPRAVALYMLGSPLSTIIGYFVAGWLNELYGWRAMFIILGLPGLALAALVRFTLREPRLEKWAVTAGVSAAPQGESKPADAPSLREVGRTLWNCTTFRHLFCCWLVVSLFAYGIGQWQPTFLIRSYGFKTGELGGWFAIIYGVGGIVGIWLGGVLATRYAANNERLQLQAVAWIYGGFGLLSIFTYLTTNKYVALVLLGVSSVGAYLAYAPLFATLQTLIPERIRAISIALLYLFANLIGQGLGPLMVGILSDAFRSWAGEESLRWVLVTLSPGYFLGVWYLIRGSRSVTADLAAP